MLQENQFSPDPFLYESFQDYLQAVVNYFRTAQFGPKTNGEWAKRLGYKSSRSFGMVLQGERLPSEEMIFALIRYLKLNKAKKEYLMALCSLERKKRKKGIDEQDIEGLRRLNTRISSFSKINLDEFKPISEWYYLPLRQFFIHPYSEKKLHLIPSYFQNRISVGQVREAVKIMLNLGFLKRNDNGTIQIERQGFNTTSDIPSHAINKHHAEMLDQGKLHVFNDDVHEREFQSLTFRCKDNQLPEAKEMIRAFKEEFNKRFAEDKGEEVFQLSIQFFKHTKSKQEKNRDH